MNASALCEATAAKAAARVVSSLDTTAKNEALERMASAIEDAHDCLLAANRRDIESARELVSKGSLQESSFARLVLSQEKLEQMARGIRAVACLDDPAGQVLARTELDDDLHLKNVTCPFGVVLAIVEARPDAMVQLFALALKSGNVLMIKAGTEIPHTSEAIVRTLRNAVSLGGGIPRECLTNVCDRESVRALLKDAEHIDLVVPRGSAELIRFVSANTQIPVLGHADGVCHIYVDRAADFTMAVALIIDSKLQSPGTCNAVETVLIDQTIAADFLPVMAADLELRNVKLRGCRTTCALLGSSVERLTENEWHTEYGSPVLAVRIVDGCRVAIAHINEFGSHHTDCIVTEDTSTADLFLREVDSAGVFHNVSTRFSDGYRYGLGAEVGISTGKLHARGPVGLEGLVTYKYVLSGKGHCVSEYVGQEARNFKHELR